MKKIPASKYCYSSVKRNKKNVKYIVIHYTGVKGDTAESEGKVFARNSSRYAGAHFFVDRKGAIVKSIDLNRTAWSVGGKRWTDCIKTGGGKFYSMVTNGNSVSIELCDIVDKDPSAAQIEATKTVIRYIKKHCPNVRFICRHFDVNGKHCPARYMDATKWAKLKAELMKAL